MAKIRRLIIRTVILVCLILGLARTTLYRHDVAIRESPVDFSSLSDGTKRSLPLPERAIRQSNGSHIDERYRLLKPLKAGGQGSVSLYADTSTNTTVVVKTISAVGRNRVPAKLRPLFKDITNTWPSELDATLSIPTTLGNESAFVAAHDYFIYREDGAEPDQWSWALVTPFISGGTLVKFAHQLHESPKTADQFDLDYRPTLDRLLDDLHALHEVGYCHDDVKPQNLFIEGRKLWLLGDLGNTRDYGHPWHNTHQWHRRNQWSDCRLNDVRRALKSYLFLLRTACDDPTQFDRDFLAGVKPWSRMYWQFVHKPIYSSDDGSIAGQAHLSFDFGGVPSGHGTYLGNALRKILVDWELRPTALWWKLYLQF